MSTSAEQDQYVNSVLQRYNPAPVPQGIQSALAPIRLWASKCLAGIRPAGSRAKLTAIKGSADADFLILLVPQTRGTLKEIYESLFAQLVNARLTPRRQNVSIGFTFQGSPVDVVPAKLQMGGSGDHSLYVRRGDTWKQTNVPKQIAYVRQSARFREIRAVKIWKQCHRLDFPSFCFELITIDALRGRPQGVQLAQNVLDTLDYIANNLVNARVVDPANTNNIVSDDLSLEEKRAIAAKAKESRAKSTWGEILW